MATRVRPDERRPVVMIVEDDSDNREVYTQFFRWAGFTVETAVNGSQAVDKARRLNPDVIIMDIRLPVMDGYQATQTLKQNPATAHIPVIALTAHPVEYSLYGALAAGCDTYLTKPCLPKELAATVREVLAWKRHGGGLLPRPRP